MMHPNSFIPILLILASFNLLIDNSLGKPVKEPVTAVNDLSRESTAEVNKTPVGTSPIGLSRVRRDRRVVPNHLLPLKERRCRSDMQCKVNRRCSSAGYCMPAKREAYSSYSYNEDDSNSSEQLYQSDY